MSVVVTVSWISNEKLFKIAAGVEYTHKQMGGSKPHTFNPEPFYLCLFKTSHYSGVNHLHRAWRENFLRKVKVVAPSKYWHIRSVCRHRCPLRFCGNAVCVNYYSFLQRYLSDTNSLRHVTDYTSKICRINSELLKAMKLYTCNFWAATLL